MMYIILWVIAILLILFYIFLYLFSWKIDNLEEDILVDFSIRNNQIPSVFEVTKAYLTKHKDIFSHILALRAKDFWENSYHTNLINKNHTHKLIHNELNFIFRVCNKHQKLNKNPRFLYIRDNVIEKSYTIWNQLNLYKKLVKSFNAMILFKNLTIIGLLIPIDKKHTIK